MASAVMLFLQATIITILEKQSTTTKTQSFPHLVDGRPDMLFIEMDSHGISRVGRGVYRPCFLVVSLAIAQFDNSAGSAGPNILVDFLSKFWPV